MKIDQELSFHDLPDQSKVRILISQNLILMRQITHLEEQLRNRDIMITHQAKRNRQFMLLLPKQSKERSADLREENSPNEKYKF